ncbi:MAG TPA: hypothetical protein VFS00_17980 [Polyangiaceae bacterium]|nr:hypothetical protein [Polyangiaceae bacterium]
MVHRALSFTFAALCAAPLAGCDARNDADYRGEVVQTIGGTVTNEAGLSLQSPDLTLLWLPSTDESESMVQTTRVPVTGGFPASFSLELYGPPPDSVIASRGFNDGSPPEPRVGVAYVLAVPSDYEFGSSSPPPAVWGLADHVLAYVDGDVAPGSRAEVLFGAPLTKGYHLMRVVPRDEAWGVADCLAAVKAVNPAVSEGAVNERCGQPDFDILVESPEGLAAPLDVRIATDHELPELT